MLECSNPPLASDPTVDPLLDLTSEDRLTIRGFGRTIPSSSSAPPHALPKLLARLPLPEPQLDDNPLAVLNVEMLIAEPFHRALPFANSSEPSPEPTYEPEDEAWCSWSGLTVSSELRGLLEMYTPLPARCRRAPDDDIRACIGIGMGFGMTMLPCVGRGEMMGGGESGCKTRS